MAVQVQESDDAVEYATKCPCELMCLPFIADIADETHLCKAKEEAASGKYYRCGSQRDFCDSKQWTCFQLGHEQKIERF